MDLISDKRIMWPEGVVTRLAPASAAVVAIEVWNAKTVVDYSPEVATTINLDIDAETPDGAELTININQDATGRAITLGAGIVGDDVAGAANDKDTIKLEYSETDKTFRVVSVYKTVNA